MQLRHLIDRLKSEKASVFGFQIPLPYFLLFVFVFAVLYGTNYRINQDKWNTLLHEQYDFSIEYPANWNHNTYGINGVKNKHDQKAQIYTNEFGLFGLSMAVRIYWVQMDEATPEKIALWGREQITHPKGIFSDFEETHIGVANYPALTRTFHYADNSQMTVQYFVNHKNSVYLLEYILRNENDLNEAKPVFERMLSSFEIID